MTPKTDSVAVLREMIAEMANFADVADRCDVTNAPPAIRCWADRLAEVLAALSAQGEAHIELTDSPYGRGYTTSLEPLSMPAGRYYLHPAPPGSDAVTEEIVASLAMEAASFLDNEYQRGRARPNAHQIREHLRAALAARTGKGEA